MKDPDPMQIAQPDAKTPHSSPNALRWMLALLAIVAAIGLAVIGNRLPTPQADTAADTHFSAGRAMKDVRAIATRPHPIGSPEIEDTRRYLMTRMTALGLSPEMRTQTAVVTRRVSADVAIGARVQNIVGELKGSDPALPAILLMAHYDTAPLSPGAGDDTAGLAVALEVARGLKAAGPARRSVIFLFTDGEEAGLLGANAFFEADPLRKGVGLVINLEARGDSGKALMFQTSANNRPLIEAYQRTVKSPAADSLMVTVYKQMPNDTDLTAALERDYVGMNFAFVGHQMAYHTPLSTPDSLNPGSIQHMGDQVLPLMRHFAQAESLEGADGDLIFADIFGQFLIAYPAWAGWLLTLVVVGASMGIIGLGMKRGAIQWRDALAGAGGLLAGLFGTAALLMLAVRMVAWLLSGMASPYAVIGQFNWLLVASILLGLGLAALLIDAIAKGQRWRAAISLIVIGLIAALLGDFSLPPLIAAGVAALLAAASLRRNVTLTGWFSGAVALIALLALLVQIVLPNGAYALVWPLALLVITLCLLLFAPARSAQPTGLAAIAVAAALLTSLMARSAYDFFVMIGSAMPAVLAPFILLAALALTPLLWRSAWLRTAGMVSVAIGLTLCITAGIKGRTPTAASPEMAEAFYIADVDKGRSSWASGKLDSVGWTKTVLTQDGGTPALQSIAPLAKDKVWVSNARPAAFVKPALAVATDDKRRIHIRASNANGGRYMRIFIKPSIDLTGIHLMSRPVAGTLKAGAWSQFIFHASGTDPVDVTVTAGGPGTLEAQMVEVKDEWPAGTRANPFPAHVIPYRRSGNSMIVTRTNARW